MRILVNSDVLGPAGGVELSSLQVCRELVARGHGIDLVHRDGGPFEDAWRQLAGDVRQAPSFLVTQEHPVRDLRAMPAAVRSVTGLHPDVLWLNRAEHLVWGLAAARTVRAPLVCHLRTHPHFPAVRTFARGVGHFVAVSGYVRDLWVQAGLRPDRVTVVHNGVDAADYPAGGRPDLAAARAALGLPPDAYVVLYYGRLHPDKGIDVLLDAWQRLALPPGEAVLVLAADPYPTAEGAAYARRIAGRTGSAGIRLLPMQPDVVPLLHAADTVVLPAQWQEPFGRVVAEGLTSGRPVLASRVGGIPEQLTGDLSRFLFDPQDAAGLADRLAALRGWREHDPGLGERCSAHARERLSLRATADGVEAVLRAAADGHRRPRPVTRSGTRSATRPGVRPPRKVVPVTEAAPAPAPPFAAGDAPLSAGVVICAYTEQRWDQLRAAVASVQAQSVRPEQLVLVVDHNDALLARCLREWPQDGGQDGDQGGDQGGGQDGLPAGPPVRVTANRYPGRLGSARNTGIELLSTDVVAFLDDDAAADPTWLETLLTAYAETGAAAVGGAPQPVYQAPRPAWFPAEFNWVYGCHYPGLPQARGPARHLIGAAMSARLQPLLAVGGFHSDHHDDMDMCHRLAAAHGPGAVVYEPKATVQHQVTAERVSWAYFWRRCYGVNRGKVLAFADLGHAGNLDAEKEFARRMVLGVLRRIGRGVRGDRAALGQAAAVVAGIGLAGAGHLVGVAELRSGRTAPSLTRGLS